MGARLRADEMLLLVGKFNFMVLLVLLMVFDWLGAVMRGNYGTLS